MTKPKHVFPTRYGWVLWNIYGQLANDRYQLRVWLNSDDDDWEEITVPTRWFVEHDRLIMDFYEHILTVAIKELAKRKGLV